MTKAELLNLLKEISFDEEIVIDDPHGERDILDAFIVKDPARPGYLCLRLVGSSLPRIG